MEKFEELKVKIKRKQLKDKAIAGLKKGCEVAKDLGVKVYENRYEIGAAVLGLTAVARTANKIANDAYDRRMSERRVWDPREQCYYDLRRPLRNADNDAIRSYMDRGYTKGEALKILGLRK